ncbi:PAS domain S-box protein [Methanomethylovorans sp.]|uniref:PAS domain S-box protein n=1 Tax=Methanomethylovorans sp. TaxID=2758717 RepID=UPI00351CAA27
MPEETNNESFMLNRKIEELARALEDTKKILQNTEDFYTEKLETLNDVVFSVDLQGRFTYINSAIEHITGYKVQEVLNTPFMQYVYPDDLPGLLTEIKLTLEGEHKPHMFRILKKNCEIVYVHTTSRAIVRDNEVVGINGIMVDIFQLKKVEKDLKQERDRAQKYLDVVRVIILVIDRDHNVSLINKKGCEIIGYTESEIIGYNWFDTCLPEREKNDAKANYSDILGGKRSVPEYFESSLIKKNGEESIFAWNNILLKDDVGTVEGILMSGEDITQRKKLECALLEAKALAENANRTKSEFLANITHEFRTPLNCIIGYSDVMIDELSDSLNQYHSKYLSNISISANKLLELVNSVLEMSRIEAGTGTIKCSEFYVPTSVRCICSNLMAVATRKNISLSMEFGMNVDHICADKPKFEQILYNLLNNAIKFTPAGGSVKISANVLHDNELGVSVKDTGIGIDKADLQKLFKPFCQIDASLERKFGGTGLGLFIVMKFVEMHNGKIWVESEEGKGSIFSFSIPLTQPTQPKRSVLSERTCN